MCLNISEFRDCCETEMRYNVIANVGLMKKILRLVSNSTMTKLILKRSVDYDFVQQCS